MRAGVARGGSRGEHVVLRDDRDPGGRSSSPGGGDAGVGAVDGDKEPDLLLRVHHSRMLVLGSDCLGVSTNSVEGKVKKSHLRRRTTRRRGQTCPRRIPIERRSCSGGQRRVRNSARREWLAWGKNKLATYHLPKPEIMWPSSYASRLTLFDPSWGKKSVTAEREKANDCPDWTFVST